MSELSFDMVLLASISYRAKSLIKTSFLARFLYPRFYSQTGEDAIIFQYFGNVKGCYLDIGSGRPIWYNNTYFLYRRGWRGVLVDPVSKNIFHSKIARPRDLSIRAAISDSVSESIFYEFEPSEYSTFNQEIAENLRLSGVNLKSQKKISLTTISDLPLDFPNDKPLLVNIDTEGFEFDIVCSVFSASLNPVMILIEEHANPISTASEIRDFLSLRNYELHAYTGFTSIYVQRDQRLESSNLQ